MFLIFWGSWLWFLWPMRIISLYKFKNKRTCPIDIFAELLTFRFVYMGNFYLHWLLQFCYVCSFCIRVLLVDTICWNNCLYLRPGKLNVLNSTQRGTSGSSSSSIPVAAITPSMGTLVKSDVTSKLASSLHLIPTFCSLAIVSAVFERWQPQMQIRAVERGAASLFASRCGALPVPLVMDLTGFLSLCV